MFVAECLLDLNFAVDSSGSINFWQRDNWDKALQFVANVSSQFTIGPNNVQVAFVLFSTAATVEWGLTRYRDQPSLIRAILSRRYLNASTNLNDALYLTRTVVFAAGRGTRPGAIKVTVILTDGEDNVPVAGTPLTLQNATACKNEGIRLMAVGVSDAVNEARLREIVSDPRRDYYSVDDFNALRDVVRELTPQICAPTPDPEPSIASLCIRSIIVPPALNTLAAVKCPRCNDTVKRCSYYQQTSHHCSGYRCYSAMDLAKL